MMLGRFRLWSLAGAMVCFSFFPVRSFAELVEVARLGVARQTSEWNGGQYPAGLAVDGDGKTFCHTDASTRDNGWELLLDREYEVARIEVQMRLDCCGGRMSGAIVRGWDREGESVYEAELADPGVGGTVVFELPRGVTLDRVRIGFENGRGNPGSGRPIVHLAEVRVWAHEQAPVVIDSFSAKPAEVGAGDEVVLSWEVLNADLLRLYPGGQLVSSKGSLTVPLQASGIFELAGENGRGMSRQMIGVVVDEQALPLQVGEIMAANDGSLVRSDGATPDWIELWNPNPFAVNLAGYGLSDDGEDLRKFVFSSGVIGAGESIVVDASDQSRDGVVATGFGLGREEGGRLIFSGPTGQILEDLVYPSQKPDVGYGRFRDGAFRYWLTPTPGRVNVGPMVEGFVAEPRFSIGRGFYQEPLLVEIATATPGARIYWTSDGSEPGPDNPASRVYDGGIPVEGTSVLRAIAEREGWEPSPIGTQTYLFADQVRGQSNSPTGFPPRWVPNLDGVQRGVPAWSHFGMNAQVLSSLPETDSGGREFDFEAALTAIPSISLVLDTAELFDPFDGLHVNARQRGRAWERRVSFEVIDPRDATSVQADCGLRMHGGWNRFPEMLKKSFRLYFRSEYGDAKLKFPLFPGSEVEEFDRLILRSGNGKAWASPWRALSGGGNSLERVTYCRDQFVRDLQGATGNPSIPGAFMHLYLNGHYWGLYNPVERPTEHFAAARFGGSAEDYDVIKWIRGVGHQVSAGDDGAWNELISLVRGNVLNPSTYQQIRGLLDLENFVDYLIVNHYAGNIDWIDNNVYAMRRKLPGERFRFYCWDSEETFLSVGADVSDRWVSDTCTEIHMALRAHPEYRILFADRVHRHLFNGGTLTADSTRSLFDFHTRTIDRAIVGESARWGGLLRPAAPYDRSDWLAEVAKLRGNDLAQRGAVALMQWKADGLYPEVGAPVFQPQQGGQIAVGVPVFLEAEVGKRIYYTLDGSDPRLAGGGVSPSAIEVTSAESHRIDLIGGTEIKARVLEDGAWSAMNEALFLPGDRAHDLVVSELMYHPVEGGAEFLEIVNRGPVSHPLADLRLVGGIQYDFDDVSEPVLRPGERLVLVRDAAGFALAYPGVPFAGEYRGGLGNGGDSFSLVDGQGGLLREITYLDDPPWPSGTDGEGHSLIFLGGEGEGPEWWRSSVEVGGNPGGSDHRALREGENLVEYALEELSFVRGEGGSVMVRLDQPAGADDAVVVPEWSHDLRFWSAEGLTLRSQDPSPGGGRRQAWELPNAAEVGKVFLRVRVMAH